MGNSMSGALAWPVAMVFLMLGVSSQASAQEDDPLSRPAQPYARAERAVLMDVVRTDKRLVAVGEQGIVLVSDDNGRQWRQAQVSSSVALTRVVFASSQQGWAVGHSGVVLHSEDHGDNWSTRLDGVQAAQLELTAAQAQNDNSERARRRLRNAEFLVKDGPDKPFLDVLFTDEQHGWVVGAYGLVFATADGGYTWQSLMGAVDNPKGLHFYRILADGQTIFLVGEQGLLLRSDDHGRSFNALPSPYKGSLFGLARGDATTLVAYGLRGHALRSNDDGQEWQAVTLEQSDTLTADARLADGSLLLADETGRVLRSTDDGRAFAALKLAPQGYIAGLVQAADGAVVVVGARGLARIEPAQLQLESTP